MAYRKRGRRGRKSSAKGLPRSFKKGKTLAGKINTLAKIVKADHAKITRAVDYSDWSGPATIINAVLSQNFYCYQLMQPASWAVTRRQSNEVQTQREAFVNSITITGNCLNGSSLSSFVCWNLFVVRAKKDWTPINVDNSANCVRTATDYSLMGNGNPVILNESKFKVLKRMNFCTFPGAA